MERARAACTFPEQLNHEPKDTKHDSSLRKWHFLGRTARLGNTSMPKKMDWFHLWGKRWNRKLEKVSQDCESEHLMLWFAARAPWGQQHHLWTIFIICEKWILTGLYHLSLCFLHFGWNYINLGNTSSFMWVKAQMDSMYLIKDKERQLFFVNGDW